MYKNIIVIFFIVIPFLVSCGTKGELYIPEERYPQKETLNKKFDDKNLIQQKA